MLTFQQIILKLQSYWDAQGCALLQPYDMEVGAGTSHTATFLRAIGPEPWKAAYVQPSRRPKDGRYGENPNRLQHYYQYQVVLKPAPSNILELYLGSLEALGFDLKKNDIRFVEDDWENPTLGAWGLGWEVWCDGMEVTQFTYFQQVGGFDCAPVSRHRILQLRAEEQSHFDWRHCGRARQSASQGCVRKPGRSRADGLGGAVLQRILLPAQSGVAHDQQGHVRPEPGQRILRRGELPDGVDV